MLGYINIKKKRSKFNMIAIKTLFNILIMMYKQNIEYSSFKMSIELN